VSHGPVPILEVNAELERQRIEGRSVIEDRDGRRGELDVEVSDRKTEPLERGP